MSSGLRILWVASNCPYPPHDGHRLREYHLLTRVARRHSLTLLCETGRAGYDIAPLLEACAEVRTVPAGYPGRWGRTRKVADVTVGWTPGRPSFFVPSNIALLRRAAAALAAQRPFDVAMGALEVAPAVLAGSASRAILDEHNVEQSLYRQLWRAEPPGPRKLAALRDWRLVRRFERRWLARAAAITACSEADRTRLEGLGIPGLAPVHVIPNGADLDGDAFWAGPRDPDLIVMVGTMGWPPNARGAEYLVREVMPAVWARRPSARVRLVGRDPPQRVRALAGERVAVTGRVEEVRPHLTEAAVEVVPLDVGGGTRLKILEAMATGVPVVSTGVGAEGLGLRDRAEIRLADTAPDMAEAILELLGDPGKAAEIATTARRKVEADYGWDAIGARLGGLMEALAHGPGRHELPAGAGTR